MRIARRKKQVLFVGSWVLVSSLLLIAAARGDDPATYSSNPGATVGPQQPKNQSSPDEILRKARSTLPVDQYDAFEKAMKRLEGGSSGSGENLSNGNEPVIDGSNIPSIISFQHPAAGPVGAPSEPDRLPATVPTTPSPTAPPAASIAAPTNDPIR